MLAASVTQFSETEPLTGLRVGETPEPVAPEGWVTVRVRAAAVNHHDLWSLKGVGLRAEQLPMILGCDAAGLDESGNPVVVHAVVADAERYADETIDPARSLLSEKHAGTL